MKAKEESTYYVYVYRDAVTLNPVYIGQGKKIQRSKQHQSGSHNAELNQWLEKKKHSIEIVGPFNSKDLADMVETSLISCLSPAKSIKLFNTHQGVTKYRFRPYGVPPKYIERIDSTVKKSEFRTIVKEVGNIIFVINDGKDFDDRPGYDLASPPTDDQISERITRWWQLSTRINGWIDDFVTSPGLLVGVYGPPGQQMIIGACEINKKKWDAVESCGGGLTSIPLKNTSLDAFELRGKKISIDLGLKFNALKHKQFQIFNGSKFEIKPGVY